MIKELKNFFASDINYNITKRTLSSSFHSIYTLLMTFPKIINVSSNVCIVSKTS